MKRLVATLVPLLLTGCMFVSVSKQQPQQDGALVFGYLDMSKAPSDLKYFSVRQLKPANRSGVVWTFGVYKNVFYHLGLPAGSYEFDEFGGVHGMNMGCFYLGTFLLNTPEPYRYKFGEDTGRFSAEERGVRFVGTHKYLKAGNFLFEKFDIKKLPYPDGQGVLERLLPVLEKEYPKRPGLEKRVRAFLKSAKKK